MPLFKINSIKLYYEIIGMGYPILLLPPLLRDHKFLRPFAKFLAKNYKTIILDLIGHGSSDKPRDEKFYSYENLAEYCYKLIDYLKINNHDIIGVSWSGRIALTYAINYPEKIRSIILIASSSPKHQPTNPPEMRELSDNDKFVLEIVWKMPFDISQNLKNIKAPTLILIGDKDQRLEIAKNMHKEIPNSNLIIIEGFGHELVGEREICAEKILYWLKNLTT